MLFRKKKTNSEKERYYDNKRFNIEATMKAEQKKKEKYNEGVVFITVTSHERAMELISEAKDIKNDMMLAAPIKSANLHVDVMIIN